MGGLIEVIGRHGFFESEFPEVLTYIISLMIK